jgi:hypothetical protein
VTTRIAAGARVVDRAPVSFRSLCVVVAVSALGFSSATAARADRASTTPALAGRSTGLSRLPDGYYGYRHAGGRRVRIDPVVLGQCMAAVLFEHEARGGTVQIVARDLARYPFMLYSLEASELNYATGQEPALEAWVRAQPEASITPVGLFERSLEVHQGNLLYTLLGLYELLRTQARFFASYENAVNGSLPAMHDFFNRFIDIRGDLFERGEPYTGDHPGSWYRMWGVMVAALDQSWAGLRAGAEIAKLLGTVDEYIKVWEEIDAHGKAQLDRRAAETLLQMVEAYRRGAAALPRRTCAPAEYLVPAP